MAKGSEKARGKARVSYEKRDPANRDLVIKVSRPANRSKALAK